MIFGLTLNEILLNEKSRSSNIKLKQEIIMKITNLKTTTAILIVIIAIFTGCKKTDDSSGLTIKAGFACGWGSGEDSLEISRNEIKYVYFVPSKSSSAMIRTSRSVSVSEWNEINEAFNMVEFSRLDYNTCNICVDGCDEWIYINDGRKAHNIRFTKGQGIPEISKLQKKLDDLRAEFNNL